MLKPTNAANAVPNREAMLQRLEGYTDRVLALELLTGVDTVEIVYNGENYHMMKAVVRQLMHMYEGWYRVEDVTGTRKFVYILRFSPIGI